MLKTRRKFYIGCVFAAGHCVSVSGWAVVLAGHEVMPAHVGVSAVHEVMPVTQRGATNVVAGQASTPERVVQPGVASVAHLSVDSAARLGADSTAHPSVDSAAHLSVDNAARLGVDSTAHPSVDSAAHLSVDNAARLGADGAAHPSVDSAAHLSVNNAARPSAESAAMPDHVGNVASQQRADTPLRPDQLSTLAVHTDPAATANTAPLTMIQRPSGSAAGNTVTPDAMTSPQSMEKLPPVVNASLLTGMQRSADVRAVHADSAATANTAPLTMIQRPSGSAAGNTVTPDAMTSPQSMEKLPPVVNASLFAGAKRSADVEVAAGAAPKRVRRGAPVMAAVLERYQAARAADPQQRLTDFAAREGVSYAMLSNHVMKDGSLRTIGKQLIEKANGAEHEPATAAQVQRYQTARAADPQQTLTDFAAREGVWLNTLRHYVRNDGSLTDRGQKLIAKANGAQSAPATAAVEAPRASDPQLTHGDFATGGVPDGSTATSEVPVMPRAQRAYLNAAAASIARGTPLSEVIANYGLGAPENLLYVLNRVDSLDTLPPTNQGESQRRP